jgi:hypothetical protein
MTNPAIVVIAYNRHHSLSRLLASLSSAKYPAQDIRLVISVDHSDNPKVLETAELFRWNHGSKEVIAHTEHMGLRKHVLSCGDLIERLGSAIFLEDDLYVSPVFYAYASECLQRYALDKKIAGISLYAHRTNVNCFCPFEPINDGTDVFFLQFASSWGQAWTAEQWSGFHAWYDEAPRSVSGQDDIPPFVIGWPASSWLKYFIKYMVDKDLYFVYPRNSLTSNYSDPGTHRRRASSLFQVPLQIRQPAEGWRFTNFDKSISIYDVFFELVPASIAGLVPHMDATKLTIDLYGTKPLGRIKTSHMLTCRPCRTPISSFGCSLKPRDANVLFGSPGNRFFLAETGNVCEMPSRPQWEVEYDLNLVPQRTLYRYVFWQSVTEIKRKLLK